MMRTSARRLDVATGQRVAFSPTEVLLKDAQAWPGICLEQWRGGATELPESILFQHGLLLNLSPKTAEVRWAGQRPISGTFCPGDVALLPAGLSYSASGKHVSETLLIAIDPEYLDRLVAHVNGRRVELAPTYGRVDAFIQAACLALAEDVRGGHPMGSMYGEALVVALAAHLVLTLSDVGRLRTDILRPRDRRLAMVEEFVAQQIDSKLTLECMAGYVGLDVFTFAKWFRRETGLAPHQYVLSRRIGLAKHLLATTKDELLAIAIRCGFSSHSHMSAAFRRFVGSTPTEFRRMKGR